MQVFQIIRQIDNYKALDKQGAMIVGNYSKILNSLIFSIIASLCLFVNSQNTANISVNQETSKFIIKFQGVLDIYQKHTVQISNEYSEKIISYSVTYSPSPAETDSFPYILVFRPGRFIDMPRENFDYHIDSSDKLNHLNSFYDDYDSFVNKLSFGNIDTPYEPGQWTILLYDPLKIRNMLQYEIVVQATDNGKFCSNCNQYSNSLCFRNKCICQSGSFGKLCQLPKFQISWGNQYFRFLAPRSWFFFEILIPDMRENYIMKIIGIKSQLDISIIGDGISRASSPNIFLRSDTINPSAETQYVLSSSTEFIRYREYVVKTNKDNDEDDLEQQIVPRIFIGLYNRSKDQNTFSLILQTTAKIDQPTTTSSDAAKYLVPAVLIIIGLIVCCSICYYMYNIKKAKQDEQQQDAVAEINGQHQIGNMLNNHNQLINDDNIDQRNVIIIKVGVSTATSDQYMPIIKFKSALEEYPEMEKEANECMVCLVGFEPQDDCRITLCLHIFHSDCLLSWFQKHPTCPFCRKKLNKKAIQSEESEIQSKVNPYILRMRNKNNRGKLLSTGNCDDVGNTHREIQNNLTHEENQFQITNTHTQLDLPHSNMNDITINNSINNSIDVLTLNEVISNHLPSRIQCNAVPSNILLFPDDDNVSDQRDLEKNQDYQFTPTFKQSTNNDASTGFIKQRSYEGMLKILNQDSQIEKSNSGVMGVVGEEPNIDEDEQEKKIIERLKSQQNNSGSRQIIGIGFGQTFSFKRANRSQENKLPQELQENHMLQNIGKNELNDPNLSFNHNEDKPLILDDNNPIIQIYQPTAIEIQSKQNQNSAKSSLTKSNNDIYLNNQTSQLKNRNADEFLNEIGNSADHSVVDSHRDMYKKDNNIENNNNYNNNNSNSQRANIISFD